MAKKVQVSRKQVDAAQAEAFTVAGLSPDPLVVRIADAGSVRSNAPGRATRTAGHTQADLDRIG